VNEVTWFPLDHSSLPVAASSAYSTAGADFWMRASAWYKPPSLSFACRTHSPVASANTTPLATAGAAGVTMLRAVHALVSTGLPLRSSTLNAAIVPTLVSPFETGNLAPGCFGPQTGASTHRVPIASSHVARLPHVPAPAKSTA